MILASLELITYFLVSSKLDYINIIRHSTNNMADAEQQYKLSEGEIEHFLKHGWIKLSNCFTKEQAGDLQKNLWTRLGMDPNDRSTW